jgi:potassium channel subfamily K, other eukaryote
MLLMVNMVGYFMGRYPQNFTLTDHQRTLILQTMLFFIWLAGGAAVFSRIETDRGQSGWGFVDAVCINLLQLNVSAKFKGSFTSAT